MRFSRQHEPSGDPGHALRAFRDDGAIFGQRGFLIKTGPLTGFLPIGSEAGGGFAGCRAAGTLRASPQGWVHGVPAKPLPASPVLQPIRQEIPDRRCHFWAAWIPDKNRASHRFPSDRQRSRWWLCRVSRSRDAARKPPWMGSRRPCKAITGFASVTARSSGDPGQTLRAFRDDGLFKTSESSLRWNHSYSLCDLRVPAPPREPRTTSP